MTAVISHNTKKKIQMLPDQTAAELVPWAQPITRTPVNTQKHAPRQQQPQSRYADYSGTHSQTNNYTRSFHFRS